MKAKVTSIHNLTDITDSPHAIKLLRQQVLPGGRLIVPVGRIETPVEQKRLARMQANREIFVGPTPPAWYLNKRQAMRQSVREAQAAVDTPVSVVEEAVVAPEPEKSYEDAVYAAIEKLGRNKLVRFAAYLRPQPPVSVQMKKEETLASVLSALDSGAKMLPLKEAMEFLNLSTE
jgi:predicted membrane-bound mannosyltransferase